MKFVDKVKELGQDIKKTVEDSDIKDKAKSAGMIITDVVEKSKKGLENKLEENRQRIEEEREFIASLEEKKVKEIIESFNNNLSKETYFKSDEDILKFTNEYYEKIFMISNNWSLSKFSFGSYIPKKYLANIISTYNKEKIEEGKDELEVAILSYYLGSKDYLLLTDKALYCKTRHINEDKVYSIKIKNEYIKNISMIEKDNETILTVNNIELLKVKGEGLLAVKKYLSLIEENRYCITEIDICEKIKEEMADELKEITSGYISNEEYFTFISNNINSEKSKIICTNKKIILISGEVNEELVIVNTINYEDIMYIGIENDCDSIIRLLGDMFKEVTLEIIVVGNKIKFDKLNKAEAERILVIVNKSKKDYGERKSSSVEETSKISEYSEKTEEFKGSIESIIEKIKALAELKDNGILTENEFETKKKELLSRI